MEELLKGDDGFYERIFEDLGLPHRPVRSETDINPGLFGPSGNREEVEKEARVLQLIHAYRVRGHLVADLDPLDSKRTPHRDLDPATYGLTVWDLDREFITNGLSGQDKATLREILEVLRDTYCGNIGVEYMYIADPERKDWLQERMESTRNYPALDAASKRRVLEKLVEAESFERFLHAKYIGHKRFSLEGGEALIPLLDRILNDAAAQGVSEVVIGMSHRGRLNVLATTVGKPLAQIFSEFEGQMDPDSTQGSGDVKYHLGATGTHVGDTGETMTVTVAPNPSHLEFVNPVVEGMVRAKQDALGDHERSHVIPILLHGDAAFAGQGIVAETLNLAGLHGYRTGGTIHVVVNNQIGFTTRPEDARSSTYCTDVAKMVHAPAFHVNGDDPEAVVYVAGLAFEYRQRFKKDVVIDVVCYRRWGHNEGDEPSYTQPLMYAKIKSHTSVAQLYGEQMVRKGLISREDLDKLWAEKKAEMQREGDAGPLAKIAKRAPVEPAPVDGSAMWARLRTVLKVLSSLPEGFEIHPKLVPFVKKRAELLEGKGDVDWATAESLAFGTLLLEGVPVRLSGQDSGRGTFSQRHAVLLRHPQRPGVRAAQQRGPGRGALRGLRQPALRSGGDGLRVRLLRGRAPRPRDVGSPVRRLHERGPGHHRPVPRGQRDQVGPAGGPRPAAAPRPRRPGARALERAHRALLDPLRRGQHARRLSVDARLVFPSPALAGAGSRREAAVVFTPKSLLRHPRCVSSLQELAEGPFQPVLDDTIEPSGVRRVVFCTGKLYYDLLKAREDAGARHVAIVRVEQLYPFPAAELARAIARYPPSAELAWAQEEPRNMGPWRFVREQFLDGVVPEPGRPRAPLHRPRGQRRARLGLAQAARARAGGDHARGASGIAGRLPRIPSNVICACEGIALASDSRGGRRSAFGQSRRGARRGRGPHLRHRRPDRPGSRVATDGSRRGPRARRTRARASAAGCTWAST